MPGVLLMTGPRKRAMKRRWTWIFTERKVDGSRRAGDTDQALAWLRKFFELVLEDDWLMGRVPRGKGHETWEPTIDWLLKDAGLARVVEGYNRRRG